MTGITPSSGRCAVYLTLLLLMYVLVVREVTRGDLHPIRVCMTHDKGGDSLLSANCGGL